MAQCKKCGNRNLEWASERPTGIMAGTLRWRLYDPLTGQFHTCKLSYEEYQALKGRRQSAATCKHGILKDRPCDDCENEL